MVSLPEGAQVPIAPGMPEELVRVVYAELRRLARRHLRRPRGRASRTTSVVHQAWIRMQGRWAPAAGPDSAFGAMVGSVIRSILVDEARHRLRLKRGGASAAVGLQNAARQPAPGSPLEQILDLDECLRVFESIASRAARVVELRYFAGLSVAETARILGVGERTVEQDWRYAKAWLRTRMEGAAHPVAAPPAAAAPGTAS